jgi:hypothetical protein
MKLYPNLKTAIITIISNTVEKKMVLDHEIQGLFKKNKQWGARDRRAIAQCSYDIIRHYELLLHLSGSKEHVVETYLEQLDENDFFDFKKIENAYKNSIPFEILYSLPVHLLKIFENQKVNQWEANWKAMQQKAPIFLRLNESQAKMDYFTQILDEYQFEYQQISELDYDNHNIKLSAIEFRLTNCICSGLTLPCHQLLLLGQQQANHPNCSLQFRCQRLGRCFPRLQSSHQIVSCRQKNQSLLQKQRRVFQVKALLFL